jgi:hypothetical protein
MQNTDRYFQSWAYWGNVYGDMSTIKLISRPYARAIAGQPLMMQYNVDTRSFELEYMLDASIKKPTEIHISPLVYPAASYNVTVSEGVQWKVDPTDSNVILIEPTQQRIDSRDKNSPVSIRIDRKN